MLRRAVVSCPEGSRKLIVRSGAGLDSDEVGRLNHGEGVIIFEEIELQGVAAGDVRARVGKDRSGSADFGYAHGVGLFSDVKSLGWVTSVKAGERKLVPTTAAPVVSRPLPPPRPPAPPVRLPLSPADATPSYRARHSLYCDVDDRVPLLNLSA